MLVLELYLDERAETQKKAFGKWINFILKKVKFQFFLQR